MTANKFINVRSWRYIVHFFKYINDCNNFATEIM